MTRRRAGRCALGVVGLLGSVALLGCAGGADEETQRRVVDAGIPDAVVVPGADTGTPCIDADGDGYESCEGDCDDTSPFIQPGARELCDGRDNNCDGAVDETFPELGTPCADGVGACMVQGNVVCAANALGVTCGAQAAEPRPETCDGTDEDCDGAIDDGAPACCEPGATQNCGVNLGRCRQGVSTCDSNQVFGPCEGGQGPADAETCNAEDDDCDGLTDEDLVGVGDACETGGMGRCGGGVTTCDGRALVCEPFMTAGTEVCNGQDDDCDGEVDEQLLNGEGLCCSEAVEDCDGVDDDCDGRTDEDTSTRDRICVTNRGTFAGRVVDGRVGQSVMVVPDQDGDGWADVLAGAPGPPSPSVVGGTVYLLSGVDATQVSQFASPATDGEFGYSLAAADFDGDGVDEWLVGAPDSQSANNHHGSVHVLEPGTYRSLATLNGDQSGSRFGESIAAGPISSIGPVLIVVGQPTRNAAAGRVAVYGLDPGPAAGTFERDFQYALEGRVGQESLGAAVAIAPPDDFGERRLLWSHADDGSPRDTELLVVDPLTSAANDVTIESTIASPTASAQTFGRNIATTGALPLMAVGAWAAEHAGSTRGSAWLMWPDGEVVDELAGLDDDAHLGFAVSVGSGLRSNADMTWCAGAVTTALDANGAGPARPGYVLCRTEIGGPVLTVAGDLGGDGFGWAISMAATPDPDGSYLLAVGAPKNSQIIGNGGKVHLFRLVPE
jgi:hypothetical protein